MNLDLHHKQGLALKSEATEILYGGSAAGGKSHMLRVAAITWCYAFPGLQVYLFRRTFDDLFKNHMEGPTGFPSLLAEWVGSGFAKINYSNRYHIDIGAGSRIHLCHCQHEKDVFKYQGAEMHVLLVDELTHFTPSIYNYLRSRVRLGGMVIPAPYRHLFPRIVNASNPGGIGHNFVRAAWVDHDPNGSMAIWQAEKKDGGMRRQYIPARLADNPTMDAERADYEAKLQGLGNPALVKAMLSGDWNIVAGGMFDDLWDVSKHIVEPFKIPAGWRIDRAFDWGSSKPFALGWWAESDGTAAPNGKAYPKGTLFHIAEWYGWNGTPNEGMKELAVRVAEKGLKMEQQRGYRVQAGPADSSIFDAENGVCIGDDMGRVGMKFEPADKGPGTRKTGAERMRKYLNASRTWPMEEPGLFVFDTCRHFIRTVPVLPRDVKDPDDVETSAEDHCYDMARYRVMHKRRSVSAQKLVGV